MFNKLRMAKNNNNKITAKRWNKWLKFKHDELMFYHNASPFFKFLTEIICSPALNKRCNL